MDSLNKINTFFRKIRKSSWKLSILVLVLFLSVEPTRVADIPLVAEVFVFANNIYNYVISVVYEMFDIPILSDIIGFNNSLLAILANVLPLLWLISVAVVWVTDFAKKITTKLQEEKLKPKKVVNKQKPVRKHNTNKKPVKYMFGSAVALTPLQKIRAMLELKELKEQCEMVFYENKNTYLRLQRMVVNDSMNEKKDEILDWGVNNRIDVPFVIDDLKGNIVFFLEDGNAKFKVQIGNAIAETSMKLNSPTSVDIDYGTGRKLLLLVVTWIGDEGKC